MNSFDATPIQFITGGRLNYESLLIFLLPIFQLPFALLMIKRALLRLASFCERQIYSLTQDDIGCRRYSVCLKQDVYK